MPGAVVKASLMGWRAKHWLFLQLGVSVCALVLLLTQIDLTAIRSSIVSADSVWLLYGVALSVNSTVLAALKLKALLRVGGYVRSFRRCWTAVMRGVAMNVVLPGRGGDIAKVFFLRSGDESASPLVGVVLVERALDVLVLCVLAFVAALYAGWRTGMMVSAIMLGVVAFVLAVAPVARRFRFIPARVREIAAGMIELLYDWRCVLIVLPISAVTWSNNAVIVCVLLTALHAGVPAAHAAAAAPVAILLGMAPISIGGMGTREAALVWLLSGTGSSASVFAAGLLYGVCVYWLLGLCGVAVFGATAMLELRTAASVGSIPNGNVKKKDDNC